MVRDRGVDVTAVFRKLMRMDIPGEKLIGFWVWEYVLKCTSDVSLIRELADSLPFPKDVPRLKQMMLIKLLSFQVSKDLDIQQSLDLLEALHHSFEDPRHSAGVEESEDMVLSKRFKLSNSEAVNVNVRGLNEKTSPDAGEAAVWKGLRQPILELKEELRKLLSEEVGARNVMLIETKLSALIKDAWALFGPVFLEQTEAAVINGKYQPQGVSIPLPFAKNTGIVDDSGAKPRNEDVSERECSVELQKDVKTKQDLDRKRQALADSRAELQKLVKDPLPALLRKADGESPGKTAVAKRTFLDHHTSAQTQVWDEDNDEIEESPPLTPSASKRICLPIHHSPDLTTGKPGESPSAIQCPPVIHKRQKKSSKEDLEALTLSREVHSGMKYRRQKKKWSEDEVEILKREVQKYGKGRWKMILQKNKDVFHGRTEVDIKDKWRNLEKYNFV